MQLVMKTLIYGCLGIAVSSFFTAQAADKAPPASTKKPEVTLPDPNGEKVNVEQIKEKYWARGEESEMGVVQNRLYSKDQKIHFNIYGGITATDPFVAVRTLGISAGFYFSEYLGLSAVVWKSFSGISAAERTFEDKFAGVTGGGRTNYNLPLAYYGAELTGSLIYGKLSLVGKKILYYDMHVLIGSGATNTQSGAYYTPSLGIGQQIYVGKRAAIRLDYRFMAYRETLIERTLPSSLGQPIGKRNNLSNSITLGVQFLIGADK